MVQFDDLRAIGERIEQLLDHLRGTADPRVFRDVEEVVRLVTELYGAGLARVVALGDRAMLERLAADDVVGSLLLVHGLHPESLEQRLADALASVRPLLAHHGGDVELLAIDPEVGAVHLRLLGSCDGCPSSALTLRNAVERAIVDAAPEIVRIDVEEPSAQAEAPVAFVAKPTYESCPAGVGGR